MRILAAFAMIAVLASTAQAHVGYKIKMTAQYKETKRGSTTFRNVFVSGHAHYPDGTVMTVMIRPENGSYLPLNVRATIQKEEFAAEMGPWKEGFPPGKYVCEAWFQFEVQTDAVKAELKQTEEFSKCLVDNPEYQKEYKEKNPERYEKLMREISVTGKCASNKQFGTCEMTIGNADDAAQADEADRAFLRDHASLVKDMMGELMSTYAKHTDPNKGADATPETFQTWATEFENQLGQVDSEISVKLHDMVFNAHKEIYDLLANSIRDLGELEQEIKSILYGEIAKKTDELKDLKGKADGDLTKDDKRRRDTLKKELGGVEKDREEGAKRFLQNLAETLYGSRGLDPAPAKKKKWLDERMAEYNLASDDK